MQKTKLFAKNFSKNSNLDDSGISLPVFPSRTNLKLHNISITPKMVKKVITNLDSSKASGPDCIPVVPVIPVTSMRHVNEKTSVNERMQLLNQSCTGMLTV